MSTPASQKRNIGLVLTGGGARAAYQAGVLQGISQIVGSHCETSPFQTITGISAGAINAAYLASRADCFKEAVQGCHRLWLELKADHILKTDVISLSRLAALWARDLGLGGIYKGARNTFLLDAQPLSALLLKIINFESIYENLNNGSLRGLSFSATNYKTGTAISFFDGNPAIEPWMRTSRIGVRAPLNHLHVLASASIPILFQPVKLDGSYYGDGSIRLRAPISPAIHLGAERILAIGIRYFRPEVSTLENHHQSRMEQITLADIAGVMLNAAFMDALESDIERMERINTTLSLLTEENRLKHPHRLRQIPLLVIRPSKDLGSFASDQFDRFPLMLRHLLKGIGASNETGWDLLSYLAFDESYTRPLLELGLNDALAMKDQIRDFLLSA